MSRLRTGITVATVITGRELIVDMKNGMEKINRCIRNWRKKQKGVIK